MSGVEAVGIALGCSSLVLGFIHPALDYRALPSHCSELQEFIMRQRCLLAGLEAEFNSLVDRDVVLSHRTITSEHVDTIRNFLHRYRRSLSEFSGMLSGMVKSKPSSFLDFRRLHAIFLGRTGNGLDTIQQKQQLISMYMIEADQHRRTLQTENSRWRASSFVSKLARVRMGKTASAAYKVHNTSSFSQAEYYTTTPTPTSTSTSTPPPSPPTPRYTPSLCRNDLGWAFNANRMSASVDTLVETDRHDDVEYLSLHSQRNSLCVSSSWSDSVSTLGCV